MNKALLSIVIVSCALVSCKPHRTEAPAPTSSANQDAIKALGSTVPDAVYDRGYWQKQHDAKTNAWQQAKRLCGQTVLGTYPNCLPINDILKADQEKTAAASLAAETKIEEMSRQGYDYDEVRRSWMPTKQMLSAGCITAFEGSEQTWRCPENAVIPNGIPDSGFVNRLGK